MSIKDVLSEILLGNIPFTNLTKIVQEYRKILSDLISLKAAIIESPSDGFQNFFIKNEADKLDFYEVNQMFNNAVSEITIGDLNDPENFDRWIKDVFNCFQENIALPELPENVDHIRIMSLHSSKGLSA